MNKPRGFALAATLWILAAIAVVVGLVTLWAREQVEAASSDRRRLDERMAMLGTRDTLIYWGATRDLTRAGLPADPLDDTRRTTRRLEDFGLLPRDPRGGELRLDGRRYSGLDGIAFDVQDEGGLLSIDSASPELVSRWLLQNGVRADRHARLRDTLADYVDTDDLRRLNGAEKRDYARDRRPPPPNRRLMVPIELVQIPGWADLAPEVRERLVEQVTVFHASGVNLNTMPEALLPTWVMGCPVTCRTLVQRRDVLPFATGAEVQNAVGVRLPGDDVLDYRFIPAETWRLTLRGASGGGWRIHVRFTPLAHRRAPWALLAAYPIAASAHHADAPATPSAFFAEPAPPRR